MTHPNTTEQQKQDGGGPAFPGECSSGPRSGMKLLDYFAEGAMLGMLANPAYYKAVCEYSNENSGDVRDHIAEESYRQAEAMLEAKRRREEGGK